MQQEQSKAPEHTAVQEITQHVISQNIGQNLTYELIGATATS